MTVPAGVEPGQGAGTDPSTAAVTPEAENLPPYHKELEQLPESVRPLVEPIFKEWDQGVQERFTKSQEQYEPWKPVLEIGDPNLALQSVQLAQALDANPEEVLKALAEAYQVQLGEAPPVTPEPEGDPDGDEVLTDPRLEQHEKMLQTIGQHLLSEQQQRQQEAEDQALEAELKRLEGEHGAFDQQYVLTLMANGHTPDDAVKAYKAKVDEILAAQRAAAAPNVVPASGGIPSTTQVDPSKMGSQDTKNLIVSMLKAANEQT